MKVMYCDKASTRVLEIVPKYEFSEHNLFLRINY